MRTQLKIFTGAVALLAIAVSAFIDWRQIVAVSADQYVGLAAFVFLGLLSQALAVESTVMAGKPVRSSISFLPLLASAVVFPPALVVAAALVVNLIDDLISREKQIHRVVFNASQIVISYGLGALLFHGILDWGGAGTIDGVTLSEASAAFFPFYGLALVFFGSNLLLVVGFVSIAQRQSFGAVLQETTGRGGGNLFYDLLASPVALLAAFLYVNYDVGGLLAVVFPFLLIRYSYLWAVQLQRANRDILRVLIKAIETRDPYTSGHSQRVSTLARMIAEDHGLRSGLINRIETAALLHDIGKIDALYAEIISKASALTEQEREVIQTHATKGADLLQSLTSLEKEIVVGVRHHHERFDGSGYPSGLRGRSIPIAARIIMICDSVDAMLSDRPYRNALPVSEVRKELQRCSGTQFDPELVDTIIRHSTLERAELLVDRSGARAPVRAVVG